MFNSKTRMLYRSVIKGGAALFVAGFTYVVLNALPYYPADWRWLIILAGAVLWLLNPIGGLFFTLFTYLLPIAYNSIYLAILYFLSFVVGAMEPYGFMVLAGLTITLLSPQLTGLLLIAPLLAGFLGLHRGAVLGALACLWAEIFLLLEGRASFGLLVTGVQIAPLISPRSRPVDSLLDFGWLNAVVNAQVGETDLLLKLFTPFIEHPILLAQIALWAVAAGVTSALLFKSPQRTMSARLIAIGSGALVLGVGYTVLPVLLIGGSINISAIALGVLVPATLAALASPVLEVALLGFSSKPKDQAQIKVLDSQKFFPTINTFTAVHLLSRVSC